MKPFDKKEAFWVLVILFVISLISFFNFKTSLRRSRDAERKADIRTISDGLAAYQKDFGFFPLSQDGKIVACKGSDTRVDEKGRILGLIPCEWGKDPLKDVLDENYPAYIETLPDDPYYDRGYTFTYFSNASRFQVYASLEGEDEAEFDPKIVARAVFCGVKLCNYGLSSGTTPLDKSIEEYENELRNE